MKKLLCLILLAVMLPGMFAGCRDSAETPTEAISETQLTETSTALSTEESTPAPTEVTTAVPTETEVEAPTESVSLSVKVDFSAYGPKEPSMGDIYTPNTGRTIPLSAPDTVYPYAGIALRTNYGSVEGYRYGLMDSKGTLLTAPIYSAVSILRDDHGQTAPFWEVQTITMLSESDSSEPDYEDVETSYGLVSMDGTVLIDCKYAYIELWEDRIVCSLPYTYGETSHKDIYDLQGNFLLNTRSFPQISGCVLSGFYGYGEGLYILAYEPENNPTYMQDVYYADEKGNLLYGPYYYASPFYHGYARVALSDGCETFLKRDGTLFPQTYHYLSQGFTNGRAIVSDEKYNNALIDTEGNIILPFCDRIIPYEGGLYYLVYENTKFAPDLYDRDGNLFFAYPNDCYVLSKDLYYVSEDLQLTFKTINSEKELTFSRGLVEYYSHGTESYIEVFQWAVEGESAKKIIVSQDLEIVAEIEQLPDGGFEPLSLASEQSEGYVIRNGGQVTLYKSPSEPAGTYSVPYFTQATLFPDGTVSFRFQDATEFYDKNGNLFFRYEFDSMDD